jgi:hypothetical protein
VSEPKATPGKPETEATGRCGAAQRLLVLNKSPELQRRDFGS